MIRADHNTLHIIQVLSLRHAQQAVSGDAIMGTTTAFFTGPNERPRLIFAAQGHCDSRPRLRGYVGLLPYRRTLH